MWGVRVKIQKIKNVHTYKVYKWRKWNSSLVTNLNEKAIEIVNEKEKVRVKLK